MSAVRLGWVLVCLCVLCVLPIPASAQQRFSEETLRAWVLEADGHPCETQLDGFLAPGRSFAYPAVALANVVSGDVLLIFDTKFEGGALSVVNPRVFAAEPATTFDASAINVAKDFRFPEGMRNCEGLRAWLRFRVNNANATGEMQGFLAPTEALPPLSAEAKNALVSRRVTELCGPALPNQGTLGLVYPPEAFRAQQEGSAVVRFSVGTDGVVADAAVIDELPPGWGFGDAALRAMQRTAYPPRGSPCENVFTQVHFRMLQ